MRHYGGTRAFVQRDNDRSRVKVERKTGGGRVSLGRWLRKIPRRIGVYVLWGAHPRLERQRVRPRPMRRDRRRKKNPIYRVRFYYRGGREALERQTAQKKTLNPAGKDSPAVAERTSTIQRPIREYGSSRRGSPARTIPKRFRIQGTCTSRQMED